MDKNLKPLSFSFFKLFLGVAAVGSFYILNQRLNEAGCRFAVNTGITVVKGSGLIGVGREVLKHKYTGYALDIGYLLVVGFIIFSSVQGLNDLENGGCEQYFAENTDTEIKPTTQFMNETEYKEWKKLDEGLDQPVTEQREYKSYNK